MAEAGSMPRLQALYRDKIVPDLCTEFAYRNRLMAPRIEKIVLNMGLSLRSSDIKSIEADRKNRAETARAELGLIAGQRPVVTRARKGIAAFRLREGQPIGVKVTLRRGRMYEFLDRLVTVALPRVRDFHGLSGNSFDGRGNYSLGVREHIAFPEIDYDKVDAVRGFDVTITTSAQTDGEARALLRGFNLPFVS